VKRPGRRPSQIRSARRSDTIHAEHWYRCRTDPCKRSSPHGTARAGCCIPRLSQSSGSAKFGQQWCTSMVPIESFDHSGTRGELDGDGPIEASSGCSPASREVRRLDTTYEKSWDGPDSCSCGASRCAESGTALVVKRCLFQQLWRETGAPPLEAAPRSQRPSTTQRRNLVELRQCLQRAKNSRAPTTPRTRGWW